MNTIAEHWNIVKLALADEKRKKPNVFKTIDTDFLPAALEIIERPVSPTARVTTWVLLSGLAITGLWLTLGKIDVVASANGKLIPVDNVKLVQPAEAGVVRSILVRNGQRVRKGQPLIALDPTFSSADLTQAQTALGAAMLDAARDRALLSALDGRGLNLILPAGTRLSVAATQRQLARAQLAEIEAGIAIRAADTSAARSTRGEALGQTAKLTETLPLLDEQIAANEALLEKGYVSKLRVIEMRRQRLIAARDRDIAIQTANKASAQISGAGGGMAQTRAEARARILTDLARAEGEANLKREELVKSTQRSSLQTLLSPVDGTVAQLAVYTIGGVVEATKPLMVIVPKGGSLVVEARLLNRDAGFVREGQSVAVKLEAFPFTRHGTIKGIIEGIGSDAIDDEKLGPVYPVRVKLNCAGRDVSELCSRISPGMAATADIKTGRRSILSYLISPIEKARLEAGRER